MNTFPAEANMAIIMKNITDTHIKQDNISINESPAAPMEFTSLLSLMGSIKAAAILYIKAIIKSFIVGIKSIAIIIISPKVLMEFFKSNE